MVVGPLLAALADLPLTCGMSSHPMHVLSPHASDLWYVLSPHAFLCTA